MTDSPALHHPHELKSCVRHDDLARMHWLCGADAFASMFRRVAALLPRRRHEPTGPLDVLLDLVLGLFVPKGASRTDIDAIPCNVVASEEDALAGEKCAICLGPFACGDVVRNLACAHDFHTECVDSWLERRNLCPICKAEAC